MSTTNPDARAQRIATALRPFVRVAAILVQFLAPGAALLHALGPFVPDPGLILVYVVAWVAVGLVAMFALPGSRSPYLLAAYVLAYVAGLFVVIQLTQPEDLGPLTILFIWAPYAVAVLVVILYVLREAAMRRTRDIGVDATATVISAGVTGMVNYVQRQRLTLRFTDQQGVERFLRVGRTGGGWSAGDTIPIRYDPTRPGSKRGIIVDGSGPTLFA